MPILSREPDCFPEDLFERNNVPRESGDRVWWLAYTRSRREKDLMRRLAGRGISHYCPVISKRTRAASGRVREAFVPLFTGYVFIFGSPDERQVALATNCLSSINAVEDQERLFHELAAVRKLIHSGLPITPEERLEVGRRVRVSGGPLQGQEGIVIERVGKRRLLVSVEILRCGASADLDECDVEPI